MVFVCSLCVEGLPLGLEGLDDTLFFNTGENSVPFPAMNDAEFIVCYTELMKNQTI